MENKEMVTPMSWDEFRDSKLLWFTNIILHLFGCAICVNMENGKVTSAYPARVKFRGFPEDANTDGYIQLTQFIKDNIDDLVEETKE